MTFSHDFYTLSNDKKIEFLNQKIKFNKSVICRRAYYLIHNEGLSQSNAMKQCWREARSHRSKMQYELECLLQEIKNPYTPSGNDQHNRTMARLLS